MLTSFQLSELVREHIYLFRNQIQANINHVSFPPNNQQIDAKSINQISKLQKEDLEEDRRKPDLKVDLWQVNHNINNQNNHNEDYVGPILSFQRRQIWSKNISHNQYDLKKTLNQRSLSKPKNIGQAIQQKIDTNPLGLTVVNNSRREQNLIHTSQQKNFDPKKGESFQNENNQYEFQSTVKPYSVDSSQKYKKSNAIIKNPINFRLSNHFSFNNEYQPDSQIRRRHKIFSLSSSKPSCMKVENKNSQHLQNGTSLVANGIQDRNQNREKEKDVYRFSLDSRPHTPKNFIHHKTNTIPTAQQQDFNFFTQLQQQARNDKQQLNDQHVKFDLPQKLSKHLNAQQYQCVSKDQQKQKESKLSIIDHFATIPYINKQASTKSRPNFQLHTHNQTIDYVPSPSQLSTILKTIQKQSKQARQSRRDTTNTRKSLYHKKLNYSIRYHQKNFYEPLQIYKTNQNVQKDDLKISRKPYHLREQFVPLHPDHFQPTQLLEKQRYAKIQLNYLDPHKTEGK